VLVSPLGYCDLGPAASCRLQVGNGVESRFETGTKVRTTRSRSLRQPPHADLIDSNGRHDNRAEDHVLHWVLQSQLRATAGDDRHDRCAG